VIDAAAAKGRHPRSLGRDLAIQMLYAWEANRFQDDGMLIAPADLAQAGAEVAEWARKLHRGVATNRTAIDGAIDGRLTNWTIHRLAATDRAILRLGAYEIVYDEELPPKVAITEAIRLAKEFGSDEKTPRLINGVLDKLARQHRNLGGE
jgi:N utilization substance protein B